LEKCKAIFVKSVTLTIPNAFVSSDIDTRLLTCH
jgi:hypothetical protein